jgi:hypothetical protein
MSLAAAAGLGLAIGAACASERAPRAEAAAGPYLVISDLDESATARIAARLAAIFRTMAEGSLPLPHDEEPPAAGAFRVLILADRAEFEAVLAERGVEPPRGDGFLYLHDPDPRARRVIAWARPGGEASLVRGLAHEAFHQRLRATIEEPPPWLNEGLAVACEALAGPDAPPRPPAPPPAAGTSPLSVAELLDLDSAAFERRAALATPLAGRLVAGLLGSPDPARHAALEAAVSALDPVAPEAENRARARAALLARVSMGTLETLAATDPSSRSD